jgi:hypothetical protein
MRRSSSRFAPGDEARPRPAEIVPARAHFYFAAFVNVDCTPPLLEHGLRKVTLLIH